MPKPIEISAPRKRRTPRQTPEWDRKAVKLARSVLRSPATPTWVLQIGRSRLTGVLTRYGRAGWRAADVHAAITAYAKAGHTIIDQPTNPAGYLTHILRQIPVTEPPALLARASAVHTDHQTRFDQALRRAEIAAARARTAAADSPGRRAFEEFRQTHRTRRHGERPVTNGYTAAGGAVTALGSR